MKKKLIIFALVTTISVSLYAGWKSALLGGGIGAVGGYMLGRGDNSCDGVYIAGQREGRLEAISNLKKIILASDKKNYTKKELLDLLNN